MTKFLEKTEKAYINGIPTIMEVQMVDGHPFDTTIKFKSGAVLCKCDGEHRWQLINELNQIIDKHQI